MRSVAFLATAATLIAVMGPNAAHAKADPEKTAEDSQTFDNWRYTCAQGACQAVLTLADGKNGKQVLSWAFVYDPQNDRLSSVVTLPLGVALPVGTRIVVSDETHYDWPFQVCDAEGCRAVAVIDAPTEKALQGVQTASVRFVPYGARQPVAISAPMKGFVEAIAKLKAEAEKRKTP